MHAIVVAEHANGTTVFQVPVLPEDKREPLRKALLGAYR
jgi:hypothetical protein